MKLLYLHMRDLKSSYKDTCIHFEPKWRFEEKSEEIWCSRFLKLTEDMMRQLGG